MMPPSSSFHPAITDFMARRGIQADALRKDGRLTLTIDGQHRLHLRPAPDGRLALQAKVITLPANPGERISEDALARLLHLGAGMLRDHASTLCFEERGQNLQLQQLLAADSRGEALDNEIAEFSNALDFWVRTARSL